MKLFIVIFLFFIAVACKEQQQQIVSMPECLLSEQKMINMMVDVALVKSAKSTGRKGLRDSGIKPLEYLYNKHGVDTIVIRENLEYYNSDLKKSKVIYEKVSVIIKERKEVLQAVMDSIAKQKGQDDQEDEEVSFNDD